MSAFQVQPIFDHITSYLERAPVELLSGISISGIFTEVGKFAGLVALAWGILKHRAVADIVPLLVKHFVTTEKFEEKAKEISGGVAATAHDKAALATQPLHARLQTLENSFDEFRNGTFKEHRTEMRDLFKEVFEKLDQAILDNARSHKEHS
jgi:hypothetical protein